MFSSEYSRQLTIASTRTPESYAALRFLAPVTRSVRPMLPNWLTGVALALIGAWKIKRCFRYRKDPMFFISDAPEGKWVERENLRSAIRSYTRIEISLFTSLPIFMAITYIKPLFPYLWPIGISIISIYFVAYLWWYRKFVKK